MIHNIWSRSTLEEDLKEIDQINEEQTSVHLLEYKKIALRSKFGSDLKNHEFKV